MVSSRSIFVENVANAENIWCYVCVVHMSQMHEVYEIANVSNGYGEHIIVVHNGDTAPHVKVTKHATILRLGDLKGHPNCIHIRTENGHQ